MELHTIILDWDGGTYVGQARGRGPNQAVRRWAKGLDVGSIPGLGPASRNRLVEGMEAGDPVALEGLANAWCYSAVVRGKLALINVVRTAE